MPTPERFRDEYDPDQYPDDSDRPRRNRRRSWDGNPETAPDVDGDDG